MKFLGTAFLTGLATILPVALTLYLIYFLAVSSEQIVGDTLRLLIPSNYYWPGLGLIISVVGVTLVGLLIRLPLLDLFVPASDAILSRIPLVKTVYSTIRDLVAFIGDSNRQGEIGKPVMVKLFDDVEVMGFVTNSNPQFGNKDGTRLMVYCPMSYQIGGYTLTIDKDRLTPVSMGVEDAMKFVVTAGVRRHQQTDKAPDEPSTSKE
ncbi:MAG: DUF502 domain-containing protein [Pseudomonadales bacterium]